MNWEKIRETCPCVVHARMRGEKAREDALYVGSLWRNRKTGKLYWIKGHAVNATNAQDGQQMVIYAPEGMPETYVRERQEFLAKFIQMVPLGILDEED